jgi:hypothetical protein
VRGHEEGEQEVADDRGDQPDDQDPAEVMIAR